MQKVILIRYYLRERAIIHVEQVMKGVIFFTTSVITAIFLFATTGRAHFQGLIPSDAKVVVNSLGVEDGWDEEVGLKTEIVPLTRLYGLWTGNVFQGIVKLDGKPVPGTEVEVEYYNEDGRIKAPADPMITQVVKTDPNGMFTYAMPKAGWWAFGALNTDKRKMKHKGKGKPVEIGAVLWVKVRDMK